MEKDKRLKHLQNPEERIAMTRILDLAERVLINHEIAVTDFFDPYYLSLADNILRGLPKLDYELAGGYQEAERQRILLYPDYYQPVFADFHLACVKIAGNKDFHLLTHRDFLGAILGLGIRREKVGDIIVGEEVAFCLLTSELAEYVTGQLSQVGQEKVSTTLVRNLENGLTSSIQYKQIRATVASLRLDSVSSHGFNISRSQIVGDIKAGKLKVNWKETTNPSKEIIVGDMIAYRGYGRILVHEVVGTTKKGRIALLIRRFQ